MRLDAMLVDLLAGWMATVVLMAQWMWANPLWTGGALVAMAVLDWLRRVDEWRNG